MSEVQKIVPAHYGSLPKVAAELDSYQVAINRGANDGIEIGDRFLVFQLGDEIEDPDTGESLGLLEIVRGRAKVVHLQERMATLESIESVSRGGKKRVIKSGLSPLFNQEVVEEVSDEQVALNAKIGDLARPI